MTPHFFISGVWKTEDGKPAHFCVHANDKKGFGKGIKMSEAEAIRLIKKGQQFSTLKWSYQAAKWIAGAKLQIVTNSNGEYLSTAKDASVTDCLDNLINMAPFNITGNTVPASNR